MFPPGSWDPAAKAYAFLADFTLINWQGHLAVQTPNIHTLGAEIADLVSKSASRDAAAADIAAQAGSTLPAWSSLLGTPTDKPETWQLVYAVELIGRMVSMHYKRVIRRPRPQQISPDLAGPLPMPQSPSYPGGHATEAFLIAECLSVISPSLHDDAMALAASIAANREIAGLNFASDTTAARQLASDVIKLLQNSTGFCTVLGYAKSEYPQTSTTPASEASTLFGSIVPTHRPAETPGGLRQGDEGGGGGW